MRLKDKPEPGNDEVEVASLDTGKDFEDFDIRSLSLSLSLSLPLYSRTLPTEALVYCPLWCG